MDNLEWLQEEKAIRCMKTVTISKDKLLDQIS